MELQRPRSLEVPRGAQDPEPEVLSMFVLRASPVFLGEMNGTATALVRCASTLADPWADDIPRAPRGRWLHKALALSKAKVWNVGNLGEPLVIITSSF